MAKAADLAKIGFSSKEADFLGHTQHDNVAANGTIQSTATRLTGTICRITTATAGINDAVMLPDVELLRQAIIFVRNDSAATVQIFPWPEDTIENPLTPNTAVNIGANGSAIFAPIAAGRWIVINL